MPDRRDGAAEPEPVAGRHVTLGDRDETRQPRLGGQQIVAVRVELAFLARGSRSRAAGAPGSSRKPNCIVQRHGARCVFQDRQPRRRRARLARRAAPRDPGGAARSTAGRPPPRTAYRRRFRRRVRSRWRARCRPGSRRKPPACAQSCRAMACGLRRRRWSSDRERRHARRRAGASVTVCVRRPFAHASASVARQIDRVGDAGEARPPHERVVLSIPGRRWRAR